MRTDTETSPAPLAPDHPLMGMLDEYAIAHARRDYQAAQTARAALTAELAKYVADAARLDALDRWRSSEYAHIPGRGDPDHSGYVWKIRGNLRQSAVRAAIDAARATEGTER